MKHKAKRTKRRAILAGTLGAGALLLVVGLALFFRQTRGVWTDDGAIRAADGEAALREILWTPPASPGESFVIDEHAYEPAVSPDGTELYFVRGKAGGGGDLYISRRANNQWGKAQALASLNTADYDELGPALSPDGNWLLFYSDRDGGEGGYDLWAAARTATGWDEPVNLGPAVNSEHDEFNAAVTPDGQRLFFASNRKAAGLSPQKEQWPATIRRSVHLPFDLFSADRVQPEPQGEGESSPALLDFANVTEMAALNTEFEEGTPAVSPVGDFLYFTSNRPGGEGAFDLYRVRLRPVGLGEVENLGKQVNTAANETDPALAMGGFRLYFSSDRNEDDTRYALLVSDSREVFHEHEERQLPTFGPKWWILAAALLGLLLLLFLCRDLKPSKLNALQMCMLLSLLAHLVLVLLLSLILVIPEVYELIREEAGMEVAVNLDVSNEVHVKMETREQVSRLPSAEPVMREISRTAMPTVVSEPLQVPPANLNIPRAQVRPATMTLQVEAPKVAPVTPTASPQLPPPAIFAESPKIAMASRARVSAVESRLLAKPLPPDPAQRQRTQPAAASEVQQSNLQFQPARTPSESLAAAQEVTPPTPIAQAAPAPPAPDALDVESLPQPVIDATIAPQTNRVAQLENAPDAQRPAPTHTRQATDADAALSRPTETFELEAQPTTVNESTSLAQAVEPQASAPVRQTDPAPPQLDAPQPLVIEPQLDAPVPSTAPLQREQMAEPAAAEALVQSDQQSPSASPQAEASEVRVAVPASQHTQDSLVAAITLEQTKTPEIVQPGINLPEVHEAVEVTLPQMASRERADEATLTGSPDDRAISEPRRPVSDGVRDNRPAESLARTRTSDALERQFDSLAQAARDDTPMAHPDPGVIDLLDLPLSRHPLADSLGPGKLTSPKSLYQRSIEQRQKMLDQLGGTRESEDAVARALRFLANNQEEGGRWTRIKDGRRRNKRGRDQHDAALTGLAVLCFLAADHTPSKPGDYQKTVTDGVEWLIAKQKKDGDLRNGSNMYGQGIAALAVAEAAIMTEDPRYREAAIKAAEFIVKAQNKKTGGWRYTPGEAGDTSVVGWQVMALHSAEQLGYTIPKQTKEKARDWLDFVTHMGTLKAGYQNSNATRPMTAEAAFSRVLLGERFPRERIDKMGEYLLAEKPTRKGTDNYYYWYYASLALSQTDSEAWEEWNEVTRSHLEATQHRGGQLDGSWPYHRTRWGERGGLVYTTAMATLTLEVYYRYLPMYRGDRGGE